MLKKSIPVLGLIAVLTAVFFLLGYRRDLSGTLSSETEGKAVFRQVCAQCHGRGGEGMINLGPPLRGRNLPVPHIKRLIQHGGQRMPPLRFVRGEALENVARYVSEFK